MATERQDRFFRGLGAAPEPFTDIYDCYFASGIISLSPDEEFVDGGAQDLFTSFRFARKARGRYRAIYAFEPDARNYVECAGNRELFDGRLHLYKLALSDRAASLPFLEDRQNSRIDERGGYEVFADTLDHCLADASPSFIKLHLEGGELAALTVERCVLYAGIRRRWPSASTTGPATSWTSRRCCSRITPITASGCGTTRAA